MILAATAYADSARIVFKNEGSTDLYFARVISFDSIPGSRSEGWFKVSPGESVRADQSGGADLYWFCFAKKDSSGQFGAFRASFQKRGDLVTPSDREFAVRAAGWGVGGMLKSVEDQAANRPGFVKAPFPLCVDARPFGSDIDYHRNLTFSVDPDAHKIVVPIGSQGTPEPIGLQEPTRDLTNAEFAAGIAVIAVTFDAIYKNVFKSGSPRQASVTKAPPTPEERRIDQRKKQEDRERARQARERDLGDYLRRVLAAPSGGDLDVGATALGFVLSGFGGSDYVYDFAEQVEKATTSAGEIREPEAFAVSGTRSPADIILTRLACRDSSFFLDVLLYQLYGGKNAARLARMHRDLLEHEGIDLRTRVGALSKAAGYHDEPRAWLTGRYKKVRALDRTLSIALLRELRDPIIRETDGGKVLWAFVDPSADVLFGSALQSLSAAKAKYAPTEWAIARRRLEKWWTEHVDVFAPLPSPSELRQVLLAYLEQKAGYSVVYSFGGKEDGQEPVSLALGPGGSLFGATSGDWNSRDFGTVFQWTDGKLVTLHRFDPTTEGKALVVRPRGLQPWHDQLIIKRGPIYYSPELAFALRSNGDWKPLPEAWAKWQFTAPARNGISFAITQEGDVVRLDEPTGELKYSKGYCAGEILDAGDGFVYGISRPQIRFMAVRATRNAIDSQQDVLVRWSENLDDVQLLHEFTPETRAAQHRLFLAHDGKLYGAVSGSSPRGGKSGFLYEIGRDGSSFRRIADLSGTVVGMDSRRAITFQSEYGRWHIGAVDLATGKITDLTDLLGDHRRQNSNASIEFMADGALWGVDPVGGQHRKGGLFRIGLPR